jgi:hypothetical protein
MNVFYVIGDRFYGGAKTLALAIDIAEKHWEKRDGGEVARPYIYRVEDTVESETDGRFIRIPRAGATPALYFDGQQWRVRKPTAPAISTTAALSALKLSPDDILELIHTCNAADMIAEDRKYTRLRKRLREIYLNTQKGV